MSVVLKVEWRLLCAHESTQLTFQALQVLQSSGKVLPDPGGQLLLCVLWLAAGFASQMVTIGGLFEWILVQVACLTQHISPVVHLLIFDAHDRRCPAFCTGGCPVDFLLSMNAVRGKARSFGSMDTMLTDVKIRNALTVVSMPDDFPCLAQITGEAVVDGSACIVWMMTGVCANEIDKLNIDAKLPKHRGNVDGTDPFVPALNGAF